MSCLVSHPVDIQKQSTHIFLSSKDSKLKKGILSPCSWTSSTHVLNVSDKTDSKAMNIQQSNVIAKK